MNKMTENTICYHPPEKQIFQGTLDLDGMKSIHCSEHFQRILNVFFGKFL